MTYTADDDTMRRRFDNQETAAMMDMVSVTANLFDIVNNKCPHLISPNCVK